MFITITNGASALAESLNSMNATIELGTVSHGTLKAQDLLIAFQAELKRLGLRNDPKQDQYVQSLMATVPTLASGL